MELISSSRIKQHFVHGELDDLPERLYLDVNLDSFIVVTGRFFNQIYDEFFLKCLCRLIGANVGIKENTFAFGEFS